MMPPQGGLAGPPSFTGSQVPLGNTLGEGFEVPWTCRPQAGGCQQDSPHPQRAAVPAAASCPTAPSLGRTHPGGLCYPKARHKGPGSPPCPPQPALDPQDHEHPSSRP